MLCLSVSCRRGGLVKDPCGRCRARMGAAYHALPTRETKPIDPGAPSTITLPIVTNPGDQTKNQVVLHVEHPTKPYQDPCSLSVCHWCIWLGAGALTNAYHGRRPNQKPCGLACGIPYQTLPDPVLAVRTPLVCLAWSWNPYQVLPRDRSGCVPFYCSITNHYQPRC